MKLCAISDLHGNLNFNVDKCDILLICGDTVELHIQNSNLNSKIWYKEVFLPWCMKQPCEKIYLIGGNHDKWLYTRETEVRELFKTTNGKVVYLKDEYDTYFDEIGKEYKIYGTPWCHQFGNWYFMTSDDELKRYFNKIPEDVDILLCHDCPYGVNDIILQDVPWNRHEHIGNMPLTEAIKIKKPKYVFTGHLHSVTHETVNYESSNVTNVSLLDERYQLTYPPFYCEL